MMDGKTRLKHVKRLTEINKLRNIASCWLYAENTADTVFLYKRSAMDLN